MRLLLLIALSVGAAACRSAPSAKPTVEASAPPPTPPATEPVHLTIIGTNDLHGWVMPTLETSRGQTIRLGGGAAFAGYLKRLRHENPGGVLLLDGGDLFQGTLASNLTEGSVIIEAYNALGYDAVAIGNHEFDYGPVGPAVTASAPGSDPFGALKARIAQARFPMLSANIYERESGLRPKWLPTDDGTVLLERKGVKVGVIGLTTPQTPTTTMPINVSTLRFSGLAVEAKAAAERLRARGAEVVVVAVHGGGRCATAKDPTDVSTCDLDSGEVFEMLRGVPAGALDAVVAGHSHGLVGHFVDGTPVIESHALGRAFGTIELFIDPATRKPKRELTRITAATPICETVDKASGSCDPKVVKGLETLEAVPASFHGQPVEVDAAITALIAPALEQVTALQTKQLGLTAVADLGRQYEAESALGSFLADSLRALEKADVALLNPGGLRADLKAGPLTYGQVFEVLPFDNAVATLTLTGEELQRLLTAAFASRKGVFQVAGLQLKVSRCPSPQRFRSAVLESGKPIKPTAKYRVVMPDFLARGGDGLGPMLATVDPARIDLGANRELGFRDALVAHWQQRGKPLVAPKPGRVSFVDESGSCPSSVSPGQSR